MAADDKVKCALPVSVWTSSKKSGVACRSQRGAAGVHILLLRALGAAVVIRNSCMPIHDGKKHEGTLGPCMLFAPGLAVADQRPLSIRTLFTPHGESRQIADKSYTCSRQPTEWTAAVPHVWLHVCLRWRSALFAVSFKKGEGRVLTFGGKALTTTTCVEEFADDTVGWFS